MLLEAFVFAYLGLQFHFLLADAVTDGARAVELLVAGVVVLAAVVLVRLAWIVAGGFVMRNLLHGRLSPADGTSPRPRTSCWPGRGCGGS